MKHHERTDHRIGGTAPGEGNIIAHHTEHGVLVSGTGITIRGNSIHSNGEQAISHGFGGMVEYPVAQAFIYNDPLDLD